MTGENLTEKRGFWHRAGPRGLLHCFCRVLEAGDVTVTRGEALLLVLACLLDAGNKKC